MRRAARVAAVAALLVGQGGGNGLDSSPLYVGQSRHRRRQTVSGAGRDGVLRKDALRGVERVWEGVWMSGSTYLSKD